MTSTCNTKAKREVVNFPLDTPVTLALAYPEPKLTSTAHGERFMYSTTDNRVMFLDPDVASKISQAGINVREDFTLTRHHVDGKDSWEIARKVGEQSNGTFVVPASPIAPPRPAAAAETARKPVQSAIAALVTEANALVDAYAVVLERALTTYQGKIKPDEIKALLISSYIQRKSFAA
jgi:hypothetical protein